MDVSRFSLAHLGMSGDGPVPLIEAAAVSGFRAVGLPLRSGALRKLAHEIVGNTRLVAETKAACRATGVGIFDVESLVLGHEPPPDELDRIFATAAELGASRMSCLGSEPGTGAAALSREEQTGRLAAIGRRASRFGLTIGLEFMMFRAIRTIGEALATVTAAGEPNLGVIVDALHLYRSGGTPEDIAAAPADRLSHCQLCDATLAVPPPERLVDEARGGRLLPGDGAIPLTAILRALPASVPLALEIPVAANAHLPVAERARRGAAALAAL
jgi:sugar phosphate isomerase/epimerase